VHSILPHEVVDATEYLMKKRQLLLVSLGSMVSSSWLLEKVGILKYVKGREAGDGIFSLLS